MIQETLEKIDYIVETMFTFDVNTYEEIGKIIPQISSIYRELIGLAPSLQNIGINISTDMLIDQLTRLNEAISSRDQVNLYDSLNYEIKDTLNFFYEIKSIMNEEG